MNKTALSRKTEIPFQRILSTATEKKYKLKGPDVKPKNQKLYKNDSHSREKPSLPYLKRIIINAK